MSRVVWSEKLVPAADVPAQEISPDFYGPEGVRLGNVCPLSFANTDIEIPDTRAYRSMSRAALLMSAVALKARDALKPFLEKDPFSVGVYCAVDSGPVDYPTTYELGLVSPEEFGERFRKIRTPKIYLKQLPNLAPAQIGIFLGLQGPLNIYNHSSHGGVHALDHAERDLHSGVVQAAFVLSGFSFEDSLQAVRARRQVPASVTLCEGAAALLLTPGGTRRDWESTPAIAPQNNRHYGISHPVIQAVT